MKVDVYRNLNQKCFSIRSREKETYGKVIARAQSVAVRNVKFVVQPAGRDRVLKTGVKNVHAFIRGDLVTDVSPEDAWHSTPKGNFECGVSYSPLEAGQFVGEAYGSEFYLRTAAIVLMTDGKYVKAKDVSWEVPNG